LAESTCPADSLTERVSAARDLLASLLGLAGRLKGVDIRQDREAVVVAVGAETAVVSVDEKSGSVLLRRVSQFGETMSDCTVRLVYDRTARRLFGPESGPDRRNGLTVLAEAIVGVLRDRDDRP
jgi:hypothetical protein